MKVLFIGGTGIISSAVSQLLLKQGVDLFHFNRGLSPRQIKGVKTIIGDIRNPGTTKNLLKEYSFDVIVDWIAFTPEHIHADIQLFRDKTKQFIFISTATVYEKPPKKLPITEETPLENPFWKYSQDKIACENLLMCEYKANGFPVTIVRPSHTYDKTLIPTDWGYTVLNRIKNGKKVIIHGDGTSLWVLTHHKDFAVGFAGLIGNQAAIGEAFHITSDELLTWNKIFELMAGEYGRPLFPVHIPSDIIAVYDKDMGPNLLGDKSHSLVFDNSKIKRFVPDFKAVIPFATGVKEIIQWYENNPELQKIDQEKDRMMDQIIQRYDL